MKVPKSAQQESFNMDSAFVGNNIVQASSGVTGRCPECLGTVLPYRNPNSDDSYHFRHVVAGDCSLSQGRTSGYSEGHVSEAAEVPLTRVYGRGSNAIYMPVTLNNRYKALKQYIRATGDIGDLGKWLEIGKFMFPQQSQAGKWGVMRKYLRDNHNYQLTELDRFNYLTKLSTKL